MRIPLPTRLLRRLTQGSSGWGTRNREPPTTRSFTAIIEREDDGYVALCPELDIASQGTSVGESRANLQEAVGLFLETAAPAEVEKRWKGEV